MSNEQKNEITVTYDVDGEKIKLTPSIVQNYIVGENNGKITMPEFKFFTELCKARGLNPFLKEAYCIKYGSQPAQIVVGKDAVLKRALRNKSFDGIESGVIVKNTSGEIIERKGTFFDYETEKLVGGWAKVFRKDWSHPTYCSVSFMEVAQRKGNGDLNSVWATKGATMVEKVAKCRALRESFIDDLGGMYEAEEMGVSVDNHQINEPEPVKEPEIVQQGEPTEEQQQPIDVTFDEL